MANYTDRALQSNNNRRNILNEGDSNTVNATYEFKDTTTIAGLLVDEDSHKNGTSDTNAGKVTITRGDGSVEIDGQEIVVSRTGGSTWNSLIMRGNDHTSSVIQLNDGSNRRIGESGVHGVRFGFCGVSAHTGSVASGGMEAPRNEAFFLQAGDSATITNILDVSISDGEVYFYKGFRSTNDNGQVKISGYTTELHNKDTSLDSGEAIGIIDFKGYNDSSATKVFASINGRANNPTASSEKGQIDFDVLGSVGMNTGLSVYADTSSAVVKISDTWTLPTGNGTSGQILTTNGSGVSSWADAPTEIGSSSIGALNDVTLGGVSKAEGQVLKITSDNSTFINAVLSYNDLSDAPTLGTSSSKDSGTGAGEVLLLSQASTLPALSGGNLTSLPSIDKLSDVDTTTNAPTSNQTLLWNGSNFVPGNTSNYTDEDARDAVGSALGSGTHTGITTISFTNNDNADTVDLTLAVKSQDLTDFTTDTPTHNQVLRYTTDSSLNKYQPTTLGTASDKNTGTTSGSVPTISDHYFSSSYANETGDLILFGRVLETIDYGSVATTWNTNNHFSIDFGAITDTLVYASEDYGVLVA
tara:strand:+ start:1615 stop:3366 length:1752 start_codon:yes stop_codon:yes gene_type:complete